MPDRTPLVRSLRVRRESDRRARLSGLRFTGLGLGILLSLVLAVLILFGALAYADLTRDLPNVDLIPTLLNPPDGLLLQPTRLYDRTGEHELMAFDVPTFSSGAQSSSVGLRRYVPISTSTPQHLPDFLIKATVVLNDPGFWTHGGYRLSGLTDPDSHPTLAQKLVSDLLLYGEKPSLRRALRERLLAAQVTSEYGRSQVLEWYLNYADYGNYAYGVDAAAQLYFGKSATDLTPAESAVLAATSQSPSLNPLDAPDLALQRGRTAVKLMQTFGLITKAEADKALSEQPKPVSYQRPAAAQPVTNALFTSLVLAQLSDVYTRDRITRGGLIVTTTLDYDLQQAVRSEIVNGKSDGPSTASLVLDPQSGQILSATGETSRGQETSLLSPHDPGSLLAPFIYLTAFTRGFGPASLVWDIPPTTPSVDSSLVTPVPGVAASQSEIASPASPGKPSAMYHGPVRMRIALANDYQAASQSVAAQMGSDAINRTEDSFGLAAPTSATLLDLASAYAIFAANGVRYGVPAPASGDGPLLQPTAVLRVESLDHSQWLDLSGPQAQPVVTPPLAYLVDNVLSDEAARWPTLGHPNELEIGRPVGVKLGSSATDDWAIGYTPSRLVAIWQSAQSASPDASLQPSSSVPDQQSTIPLLSNLLQLATASLPADGWAAPPGVSSVDVCDPSGLLPTKDCPTTVTEVFLSGNEPTQSDTLYRTYTINRETGLLATVFTPPDLVVDQPFMIVPPEAQEWAKSAGIPVAPTSYDAIQAPPIDPNVHISSPALFSDVTGKVQFRGTASGPDFDHYRILVGQGLNPQAWIQVGSDSSTRIEDGLLGTWDTTGLSGLYAVELQVIRTDQQIVTAITQLTVK